MRALTYEEWSKEGRGVQKGSKPFAYVDGMPLFDEKDTYNLEKGNRKSKFSSGGWSSDDLYSAARNFGSMLDDVFWKHHPGGIDDELEDLWN